jgi:hypothetical protein
LFAPSVWAGDPGVASGVSESPRFTQSAVEAELSVVKFAPEFTLPDVCS